MNRVNVSELLRDAIKIHQSGDLKRAHDLYQKILKIDPFNADAYHNSGLIYLASGNYIGALEFFEKALEFNNTVSQFWLSIGQVLFDLGEIEPLKIHYKKAKNSGVNGEICKILKDLIEKSVNDLNVKQPSRNLKNELTQLISIFNKGDISIAKTLSDKLVVKYPSSFELAVIQAEIYSKLKLHSELKIILSRAIQLNPNATSLYVNLGATLNELYEPNDAIYWLHKAIEIEPLNYLALKNLANAHEKLGNFEQAIEYYERILSLKPDIFEIQYNLGTIYKKIGKLELSKIHLLESIKINPHFAYAQNNLANTYRDLGEIQRAILAYEMAITLDPSLMGAILNYATLCIQLVHSTSRTANFDLFEMLKKSMFTSSPKASILLAILTFIREDYSECLDYIESFERFNMDELNQLEEKDLKFCQGYYIFLKKLFKTRKQVPINFNREIFHIGESHCLSFSGCNLNLSSDVYRIRPLITFGAKAYHFSQNVNNVYKAITTLNFKSINTRSKVFLSFGEIDCRPDEGFILAQKKLKTDVNELIETTVDGYVKFFIGLNKDTNHELFFLSLPAPVFNIEISEEENRLVADNIKYFNETLGKLSRSMKFTVLDTYSFTIGDNDFSNGKFHIDRIHLGNHAIDAVQKIIANIN